MENPAELREYLERVTLDLRKARRRIEDLEKSSRSRSSACPAAIPAASPAPRISGDWSAMPRRDPGRPPRRPRLGPRAPYDPDVEAGADRVTSYAREGGFMADAADFDAAFIERFSGEAAGHGPEQRLLLEASWEALEDAGHRPALAGRDPDRRLCRGDVSGPSARRRGRARAWYFGGVAYTLGLEGRR